MSSLEAPGEGGFIVAPSGQAVNAAFAGAVKQGQLSTSLPLEYSIRSSMVPQAGLVHSTLGLPLMNGDSVQFWRNAAYVFYGYDTTLVPGGWYDVNTNPVSEPSALLNEAFFLFRSTQAGSWTRTFSPCQ